MGPLLSDYQIELLIAAGFTFFLVVAMKIKAWQWGDPAEDRAGLLRTLVISFLSAFAVLLAMRHLEGMSRGLAIVAGASFTLAIVNAGRQPLLSAGFARSLGIAFIVCLALWGLNMLLVWLGVDMERRHYG